MIKLQKYKDGNSKKITVNIDDADLMQVSESFLRDIENNFNYFKTEYEKSFAEMSKYLTNNKNYHFRPEKLTKRSPLTIINAPWGTGKTYFIENFVKLFIDEKLKSKVFKKIIVIDAWKFSNSRDVPVEFAEEISKIIVDLQSGENSDEIKDKVRNKLFKALIPKSANFTIGIPGISFSTGWNSDEKKDSDQTKKIWKNIQDNEIPTIIFIDNLERLGSSSWDLLKSIIKLQEFSNYLIVLPLNLNKLSNNTRVDNSEYPIEKYIDFNYYNFEQDYTNFFKTYFNRDDELIINLNNIFNSEIEGEKLSIRELENLSKMHNLSSFKIDYDIYKTIRENIWDSEVVFQYLGKKMVNEFIDYHKKLFKIFDEIGDVFLTKTEYEDVEILVNFGDTHFENDVLDFAGEDRYYYNYNTNYIKDFMKLNKAIEKTRKVNAKKIDKLSEEINQMIEFKNELEKGILSDIKKLEVFNKKSENFKIISNEPSDDYDVEEHSINDDKIKKMNDRILGLRNSLKEKIEEIDSLNFEKQFIEKCEEMNHYSLVALKNKISEFNKTSQELNWTDFEIKKVQNFLESNCQNPENFNKETFIFNFNETNFGEIFS